MIWLALSFAAGIVIGRAYALRMVRQRKAAGGEHAVERSSPPDLEPTEFAHDWEARW